MNLALSNNQQTMSSREIATLTDKEHKNVIRDIRVMLDALGDGADLSHPLEVKDSRGYTSEFHLPKDLTLTLVTGYDVKRRHAINVRWLELEASVTPAKPLANPQLAAMVLLLQQLDATQQEQKRQALEVSQIQETIAVLEARTQPENKHFTLMGYANLMGHKLDLITASKLGKKCAKLSRDLGVIMGSVKDPRFGKVLSYHESILESVLAPITH